MEPEHEPSQQRSEKLVTTAAFFVFSFVPYALAFAAISAAEDILVGTVIPTSVVYLCDVGPFFLATLILPLVVDHIPPLMTMLGTFVMCESGIILIAVFQTLEIKMVGVVLMSLANGFGDVGFLSLTALYGEVVVRSYSAGIGYAMAIGSIYYTGMTTWFHISLNTTLLAIIWVPFLLPIFYLLMDKKHCNEESVSKPTSYEDVPYSPLNPVPEENARKLTLQERVKVMWENGLLFVSLFIGEFCEYLLIGAIVTTLAFPNAPFTPRDHYQYYVLASMIGELLGTSYGLVMFCLKCRLPDYTKHTWIFAMITTACTSFLASAAWFRFLQSVWVVICVVFVVGLTNGALYNCTFAAAAASKSSSRHKGFARAFLTAASGAGPFAANLLGIYFEPMMRGHCVSIIRDVKNCITRVVA